MRRALLVVSCPLILAVCFQPVSAAPTAATLYSDCSAFHIPVHARKADHWIRVKRCETVVVNTVRGLNWPPEVPWRTKDLGDGFTAAVICPTNTKEYSEDKLIELFLRYWDQKGVGYISGKFQSAQSAVIEAFSTQFPECAENEGGRNVEKQK